MIPSKSYCMRKIRILTSSSTSFDTWHLSDFRKELVAWVALLSDLISSYWMINDRRAVIRRHPRRKIFLLCKPWSLSIRRKRNALVFFFCGRREILDFLRAENGEQLNKWTCQTMDWTLHRPRSQDNVWSSQVDSIPLEGCPIINFCAGSSTWETKLHNIPCAKAGLRSRTTVRPLDPFTSSS